MRYVSAVFAIALVAGTAVALAQDNHTMIATRSDQVGSSACGTSEGRTSRGYLLVTPAKRGCLRSD